MLFDSGMLGVQSSAKTFLVSSHPWLQKRAAWVYYKEAYVFSCVTTQAQCFTTEVHGIIGIYCLYEWLVTWHVIDFLCQIRECGPPYEQNCTFMQPWDPMKGWFF